MRGSNILVKCVAKCAVGLQSGYVSIVADASSKGRGRHIPWHCVSECNNEYACNRVFAVY